MSRRTRASLLAIAAFAATTAPAGATTISLRGVVPTICQMRYTLAEEDSATRAELIVFCNAPEGARLSGMLVDGGQGSYLISHQGGSFVATPGVEFDIRNYSTAFSGTEYLQISTVGGGAQGAPTIVFEIIPEG